LSPADYSNPGPILFFDGECGLCQHLVRRLLALDQRGGLRFAPLQGPTAQAWLRERGLPTQDFQSLIYLPEGLKGRCGHLRKTDGIIAALHASGHPRLARCLRLVPRSVRDLGYRVVARTRHRIFGGWKPGRPLRREWAERVLD
jgi:predicted DCC family thiol-disulfide oxidoreductase YuxK